MTSPLEISPQPRGCTALKLRRFERQVNRHYDAEVGKVGLKITQYSLLSYVVKAGPLRPVDLATALRLEPSTLTRNLRLMEQQGWLVQQAGDDARSRQVVATPAGIAKRAEAQKRWRAAQESLNRALGTARVAALHALLDEAGDLLADSLMEDSDE
jgi:DNA-binding MarR family transcriptional regulator